MFEMTKHVSGHVKYQLKFLQSCHRPGEEFKPVLEALGEVV